MQLDWEFGGKWDASQLCALAMEVCWTEIDLEAFEFKVSLIAGL